MTRMNSGASLVLVIPSFFIVTMMQSNSLAEDLDDGYPAIVSLDVLNGEEISEHTIISGIIQNEMEPISASFELFDSSGTRFFLDFTDGLTLSEINNDWKKMGIRHRNIPY